MPTERTKNKQSEQWALPRTVYVSFCPLCTAGLGVGYTRGELRDLACEFCAPGKRGKVVAYVLRTKPVEVTP